MHAESKTASMTASPVIKVTEQRARRRQRNVRDRQTEIERGRQCRRQRRHTRRRTHALGHAARISCVLFSVSVHPNGRQVNVPTAMVLTRPKFKIIAAPQRWEFRTAPQISFEVYSPKRAHFEGRRTAHWPGAYLLARPVQEGFCSAPPPGALFCAGARGVPPCRRDHDIAFEQEALTGSGRMLAAGRGGGSAGTRKRRCQR